MGKYYTLITDSTNLERRSGANATIPTSFNELSTSIISTCTHIQSLLQQVIFVTHASELIEAKRALKTFPNPKARIDFLCSYPYSEADPVVSAVFEYARVLFRDIYELRNILSHEVWASSEKHEGAVIFSSLDQEAKLLMVSGRLLHTEEATSQETYDGIVQFIRSVKVVSLHNLEDAVRDANLCSWILMHIGNILNEPNAGKREDARKLFRHFRGTSHLFGTNPITSGTLTFNAKISKEIKK